MATEMQMNLSPKEKMLVGLTATLAPLMLVEIYSVAKTRAETPEFATDPNMPQARDLLVGVGFALALIVLRRVLSTVLQPLGRLILDPRKSASKDRMDRFGTVLFKFLYVALFVFVACICSPALTDCLLLIGSTQVLCCRDGGGVLRAARRAVAPARAGRQRGRVERVPHHA